MALNRSDLEDSLNELGKEAESVNGWGNRVWTQRVKETLVGLALDRGYKTYTSGVSRADGSEWGEYLYDLVWLEVDPNDDFLVRDVPLVAEIEWGDEEDIWDDFQKLPIARAAVRVMIFDTKPGLIEKLKNQMIRDFKLSADSDRYLFASYDNFRFSVEEFIVRK